jgi:hypothetical protein
LNCAQNSEHFGILQPTIKWNPDTFILVPQGAYYKEYVNIFLISKTYICSAEAVLMWFCIILVLGFHLLLQRGGISSGKRLATYCCIVFFNDSAHFLPSWTCWWISSIISGSRLWFAVSTYKSIHSNEQNRKATCCVIDNQYSITLSMHHIIILIYSEFVAESKLYITNLPIL